MRIAVYLPSDVGVFRASAEQLTILTEALPQHEFTRCETEAEFLSQLPRVEAAVVWRFPSAWHALAPELRHLFTPAAGKEGLAPDPLARVELHFGSFHGHIMAESVVGMILLMTRRFDVALRAQLEHRWERNAYVHTRRLAGQTALILGFGAIGRHTARLLRALGLTIHAYKRSQPTSPELLSEADRWFVPGELSQALSSADHVVCILPGDASTQGLLNEAAFLHMKPSAYLYNVGRGNAIDGVALFEALEAGRIAGAFLDVFETEPLSPDSPLWQARNLVITPHASAVAREYLDLYFRELVETLAGWN